MARNGPIVIVEDDLDDQEIINDVLQEIGIVNKLIYFTNCPEAFTYLKTSTEQQFLILSDINLPGVNGLEFKKQIDNDQELRQKSIPFVFFSTSTDKRIVTEAFTKMTVQGFFQKCNTIPDLKKTLSSIMEYWKLCYHPNTD